MKYILGPHWSTWWLHTKNGYKASYFELVVYTVHRCSVNLFSLFLLSIRPQNLLFKQDITRPLFCRKTYGGRVEGGPSFVQVALMCVPRILRSLRIRYEDCFSTQWSKMPFWKGNVSSCTSIRDINMKPKGS